MNILVLQNYDNGFKEVGDITSRINEEYAQKHGYQFVCYRRRHPEVEKNGICVVMDKILWCRDLFLNNKEVEYILFIDSDAIILNHTIKLESIIDENYDFIFTRDVNYWNTGTYIIKNSDWSIKLLEWIWEHRLHEKNQTQLEQLLLGKYIDNFGLDHIKVVSQGTMNSYPYTAYGYPANIEGDYKHGQFICHFPAMHNWQRKEFFNKLIPNIIK